MTPKWSKTLKGKVETCHKVIAYEFRAFNEWPHRLHLAAGWQRNNAHFIRATTVKECLVALQNLERCNCGKCAK